jgi:outer membrane lipoprotein carrier protein
MPVLRLFPCALAVVSLISSQVPARPPAAEVARQVQQKYDRVLDFSADFTHTYEGGVLKKTVTERGTVQIKKPGKMRWDYTSPDRKEFVSDGHQIYSYVPVDKQVIVSPMPEEDEATTAILFLVGKGNVTRDFTVSFADTGGPDTWALRLQPRQRQRDYDWLVLEVDRQTMQIRALVAGDQQGGRSTFRFANYRENQHLADKIFAFTIPRGVDVVHSGATGR